MDRIDLGDLSDLRTVRLEREDGVAIVTLDRPDRMNGWTGRMHTEYRRSSPTSNPIPPSVLRS